MSAVGERFRAVAAGFTARVEGVPEGGWERPAPCEGWTARDVVRHLVEWVPGFFGERYGVSYDGVPSVDDDPAGAWAAVRDRLQAALDDPATATKEADGPMGRASFEQTFSMIALSDVLIHTWDLARATGQDEALDASEVAGMVAGLADAPEEAMRASGHFGPRVAVGPDASPQDQLLAFMGRQP
ncbi:MAG: TIGR03086 family protein [Actinobacteria bacterium]|nr:TIGR03086 family protein [Actinomycetota bacterium]